MPEAEWIDARSLHIRRARVMLDSDLAAVYGVEVKALNRAVKRNLARFPERFVFQLTKEEWDDLKCQFGTSSEHGGRRFAPYVFTEHGAVMLASVLNSPAAVAASIHVVDAFVRLRRVLGLNAELNKKLEALGGKVEFHDKAIAVLFDEIKKLADPAPEKPRRRIGLRA